MSKPTNLSSHNGCVPTASTCIIWQGKDIDCLQICNGQSIDDVIHQLGCLVCTIKDQLNPDTYDLECFNLDACDIPHTFRELMQFMLEIVCQVQDAYLNGDAGAEPSVDGIPSVSVASCFTGQLGNSALITDYIEAIGELVCEQQNTIANQQQAILQMQEEIAILKG
jgi:hypothetical protein